MKKVLLVVIDALASRIVVPAIEEGRLPVLAQLVSRGVLRADCTSIFPSITPAATASIITGVYPVQHGIAGGFWYDKEEDSAAYFGDDFWVVIDEGIGRYFNDFLIRLNAERLQSATLYQRVEQEGLTAAALNFMWFRGETRHPVDAPWLFKLLPGIQVASEVYGPKVLALADFAASKVPGREETLSAEGGVSRRFGFHDDTTGEYLTHLASADPFPDFTLAYFPNNDFVSHAEGPLPAVSVLESVDAHLGRFIEAIGGMEQFLSQFAILISGDHAQTDMIDERDQRGIDVAEHLEGFQAATPGQPWQEGDEVIICPNMRACHIYVRDRTTVTRDAVIRRLLEDSRVDQVLWRSGNWRPLEQAAEPGPSPSLEPNTYYVAKAGCGRLSFRPAGQPEQTKRAEAIGSDLYGNSWHVDGDLTCVDARLSDEGEILYGEYPNALERIATGFCANADDIWVTAKAGHEFEIAETSIHAGGSHGALNRDDSTVPLIAAGLPDGIPLPEFPRTIDLAPLCLQILGLEEQARQLLTSRTAGAPR